MMLSEIQQKLHVETINWHALAPTYPYRFNGPAYLYCVGCLHFICLAQKTTVGVRCVECDCVLAKFVYENMGET